MKPNFHSRSEQASEERPHCCRPWKCGWVIAGLLVVLSLNVAIRWRLADVPLERDEGEYAYAGQLMLQGIPPYQLAYNMKFPGAYFGYAGLMAAFGETTRGIHFGIAALTSLTAVLIFILARKSSGDWGGVLAAASYVLLSALPTAFGLAGHATHFVALFATAGAVVLLAAEEKPTLWRWGLGGVLFGVAILMKQHAVALAGTMLLCLAWGSWRRRKEGLLAVNPSLTERPRTPSLSPGGGEGGRNAGAVVSSPTSGLGQANAGRDAGAPGPNRWATAPGISGKHIAAYVVGCIVPLILTALGLAAAGVWRQFTFWTLEYARQYASAVSIRTAGPGFQSGFDPIFNSAWPLWALGGIGFLISVWPRAGQGRMGLLLFIGGMLATVPGYHFRGHYFLAAMPGLALLIATAAAAALRRVRERGPQAIIVTAIAAALVTTAWINKSIWFELPPDQVARQLYSLNPFPEAPKVAEYLRTHTAPDERIAVVGSEPQIYFHAKRHAATGYIYMYALTEPLPLAQRMRDEFAREMESARPRYVVFVDIITSWVSLSAADNSILTWWNEFVKNYEPVGAVTVSAEAPTTYCWDEAAVRTLDLANCHLVVYRRKEAKGE